MIKLLLLIFLLVFQFDAHARQEHPFIEYIVPKPYTVITDNLLKISLPTVIKGDTLKKVCFYGYYYTLISNKMTRSAVDTLIDIDSVPGPVISSATHNWWGTTDVAEIESMIRGYNSEAITLQPIARNPYPAPGNACSAAFTAMPTSGTVPLSVSFTDESVGSPALLIPG